MWGEGDEPSSTGSRSSFKTAIVTAPSSTHLSGVDDAACSCAYRLSSEPRNAVSASSVLGMSRWTWPYGSSASEAELRADNAGSRRK